MQPGTHVAVSIGIVELVGLVTGQRPQGAETLLPLVCGVLIDVDHGLDRFVGKRTAMFNPEAEGLTPAEASEKAKWHLPHYVVVGWPLILLGAWLANQIGVSQEWEWLALSNFWVFWAGMVPYLAHTLLDVTLITHGGDWNIFPLNYLFRLVGIRLPLGIVPNGTQAELRATYILNAVVAVLLGLMLSGGARLVIGILTATALLYGAWSMKRRLISPKASMAMAIATLILFAIARW